jgi:hypothetical protein
VATLENLVKTDIIVSASNPTETAAYNEYAVSLYSWTNLGLKMQLITA